MDQLNVYLFGKFVARYKQKAPIHFTSHKVEELFCLLLIRHHRGCSREVLASLLWDTTTTRQSKKYLRTALWQLKSDLGFPSNSSAEGLLSMANGWIQLCPEACIWTDVYAMEQAYDLVQSAPKQELDAHVAATLTEAVELYDSKLLEGWYQEWCSYERERVQHMYFRLTDVLMTYCEQHSDFNSGLSLGLRMLGHEPTRECTYRRMMRLYYLAGDRCSALRQYQRCTEILREELDVGPSGLTQALYEQIRADHVADLTGSPAVVPAPPATRDASLRKVLRSLEQLQAMLEPIRQQLQQEIKKIETASDHAF